jgi:hypothetical protein
MLTVCTDENSYNDGFCFFAIAFKTIWCVENCTKNPPVATQPPRTLNIQNKSNLTHLPHEARW